MKILPSDIKERFINFYPGLDKITIKSVRRFGREIVNISLTNKEMFMICQNQLNKIKKIHEFACKYHAHDAAYEITGSLGKGGPQLLEALSPFHEYNPEREEDIKQIVKLSPRSLECDFGQWGDYSRIKPLAVACLNPQIPIQIIDFLFKNGANPNIFYYKSAKKNYVLTGLRDALGAKNKRFKSIEELFQRYGANKNYTRKIQINRHAHLRVVIEGETREQYFNILDTTPLKQYQRKTPLIRNILSFDLLKNKSNVDANEIFKAAKKALFLQAYLQKNHMTEATREGLEFISYELYRLVMKIPQNIRTLDDLKVLLKERCHMRNQKTETIDLSTFLDIARDDQSLRNSPDFERLCKSPLIISFIKEEEKLISPLSEPERITSRARLTQLKENLKKEERDVTFIHVRPDDFLFLPFFEDAIDTLFGSEAAQTTLQKFLG